MADLPLLKVIVHEPSGFSDRPARETPAFVHGYCFGEHLDAHGYNQRGSTVLAIVVYTEGYDRGRFAAVPIAWLRHPEPTTDKERDNGQP
jgi:hypothetical protein